MLFPLLVLLAILAKHRNGQDWRTAPQPEVERETQSIVTWAKLPFVPLSNRTALTQYLHGIFIVDGDQLSSIQHEKLYDSILRLTDAYSVGTLQAYMDFRLPEGAKYDVSERQMTMITADWNKLNSNNTRPPTNDLDLFEWWVGKQSDGGYYKDFWQGICMDPKVIYNSIGTNDLDGYPMTAGIIVSNRREMSPFGDFVMRSTFNAGIIGYTPSFIFKNTPFGKVSQDTNVMTFSIYFFVQPSPPDPILPVDIRYMWDSESTNWVPTDFIMGNLLMHSKRYCAF